MRSEEANRLPCSENNPFAVRDHLAQRFAIVEKEISIATISFSILKVRDTNALVDSIDPTTFSEDERLPYWADLWTSSLELARSCLVELDLKGKTVLELGAGLGLSGIAAAKRGASVTFSDYEQDALDFSYCNAARNLSEEILSSNTRFLHLDWRDVPSLERFDMILGADVVYERRTFFPLIDVFQKLLKPDGVAVLTEPCRSIGEHFFGLLREEGFRLTTSTHDVALDGTKSSVRRVIIHTPALVGRAPSAIDNR